MAPLLKAGGRRRLPTTLDRDIDTLLPLRQD